MQRKFKLQNIILIISALLLAIILINISFSQKNSRQADAEANKQRVTIPLKKIKEHVQ